MDESLEKETFVRGIDANCLGSLKTQEGKEAGKAEGKDVAGNKAGVGHRRWGINGEKEVIDVHGGMGGGKN
jgi:hypothetical protein